MVLKVYRVIYLMWFKAMAKKVGIKKSKVLLSIDTTLLNNLRSLRKTEGLNISAFMSLAAVERLRKRGFFK